jgi:hypothetical protein
MGENPPVSWVGPDGQDAGVRAGDGDRGSSVAPRQPTTPEGAVHDMQASLRRGYARYQVAIAATAAVRRIVDRHDQPSHWRDVAIGVLAAEAAASALTGRRPPDEPVPAWWDAAASAAASVAGLAAGGAVPGSGVWPAASREASAMAQWASAGANLLGTDGPDRAVRLALIGAPYVVWPTGRRTLRRSRLLPEAAVALAVFAASGRVLVGVLRSTAADVDERSAQVVAERAEVATLDQEAILRNVVIAETATRLRQVREQLGSDRPAAAASARREETRLRAWLAEQDDPVGTATAPPSTTPPVDAAPRLARFLAASESVLRSGAAAQLVFEAAARRRPHTATALAAVAAGHAAWSCRRLLAREPANRRPMVAADLAVLALCGVLEAVESRRGHEPGWTRGFSEALFAATGGVADDRELAAIAVAGVGAVAGLGSLAVADASHDRLLRAAERSASAGVSAALAHWFADLVTDLGDRLTAATEQLAAVRAAAVAAEVRRNGQYFLHDSALQVLLWVQKPDLTDAQLRTWLDREIARLDEATVGAVRTPDLTAGLDDLVRGFRLLGLEADAVVGGDARRVPPELTGSVLEVCNECLANALRHSPDRSPSVRIDVGTAAVTVEVVNRTDATEHVPVVVAGTGTRAMADRVAAVGGRIDVQPSAGRFVVRAVLPLIAPEPTGLAHATTDDRAGRGK